MAEVPKEWSASEWIARQLSCCRLSLLLSRAPLRRPCEWRRVLCQCRSRPHNRFHLRDQLSLLRFPLYAVWMEAYREAAGEVGEMLLLQIALDLPMVLGEFHACQENLETSHRTPCKSSASKVVELMASWVTWQSMVPAHLSTRRLIQSQGWESGLGWVV